MGAILQQLSPAPLLFVVIAAGCCAGKIRLRQVSLGIGAVLPCAVAAGYLLSLLPGGEGAAPESMNSFMETVSVLGTALFVPAVGLPAGGSAVRCGRKKGLQAFLFGSAVVCLGFVLMKGIGRLDEQMTPSALAGMLSGAMTSTPGMSAACARPGLDSGEVILGYACTYPFGLLFTVLFVRFAAGREQADGDGAEPEKEKKMASTQAMASSMAAPVAMPMAMPLLQISLAAALGTAAGRLSIPGPGGSPALSLGSTGGILLASLIIGAAVRRFWPDKQADPAALSLFRSLGLALFLAGSGIRAGERLREAFCLRWLAYGAAMTALPVLLGYLAGKALSRGSRTEAACLTAGAMTSTPAAAILREQRPEADLGLYSAAYLGALLTMTVGQQLL